MRGERSIHIGTSGWQYKHWKGPFYPEDLKAKDFLDFYKEKFRTVEINNSFYQLPEKTTFKDWSQKVPKDFIFSVKASRYITHMKKLKDPRKPVKRFFKAAEALGKNLGPVLFQLPPNWRSNPERLESFLKVLPKKHKYAFEFRDESWFTNEVYEILSDHNAAFCIYELGGTKSPREITADFIYIRLHGPGDKYQGKYSPRALSGWAGTFSKWIGKVDEIYCYFDNDQKGYAAENALKLQKMIKGR